MVVSKLDEQMLEQIALTTGGAYIRATNRSLGLDEIVQKINEVEKKSSRRPCSRISTSSTSI